MIHVLFAEKDAAPDFDIRQLSIPDPFIESAPADS